MSDIVITGMAWHTALGHTLSGVWQRLLDGETGIATLASPHTLKNDRAAAIVLAERVDTRDTRDTLERLTRQTVAAAAAHAQLDLSHHAARTVLVVGTSFGARLDDALAAAEPLDRWVQEIADGFGLASVALSTACSSGSDALLLGAELIRAGVADRCICGGADVLADSKRLAHTALGTMSPTTLRSFDRRHDGTILGEGVGFLVLERGGERAVPPLAVLRGAGSSNDAAGLTAPDKDGNGIRLAIERSLKDAGLRHADIGVVNAHGSGTLTNDRIESAAYLTLFGASQPTIFATKGSFGHTLGATGALEAIALILALQEQVTPPIYELEEPIEGFTLPMPVARPRSIHAVYGLSLTIGFGGFNTSLVFEGVGA
ncbi:MAG: beta-ketoacyl synthase N-terminal-like domain-containing protein [Pseudomonadota bacterium]|uniref:beta-ketoacyl synthase N-terminal-like domain-containing protein n=1 Tax=Burkholderiaceae TaxID=119060 RepID=UPI0010F9D3AC|nr:beta-ketoacyl synthase N-terminal-like domain-containing protein [Burkholderia sp. 4M9327F10]